ncbi:MAG: hypothetical protein J0I47_11080 [Sphingomonas sp.]|uniref:hypothetical protein n=1 Tax=Sphingomonas sp. TaxID=28214 RepID=UPI001AC443E8|nr:hypothetical protein [Sphingomonas sp.]MBN8808755.1 hypothetical protein [Sphingomonas sp.]
MSGIGFAMPDVDDGSFHPTEGRRERGDVCRCVGTDMLAAGVDPLLHHHLHVDYHECRPHTAR